MTIEQAAQTIWDYHQMNHTPSKADIIWALGSHDLRVADRAAELWQEGLAPLIVMSGGLGNFTEGVFQKPEADLFAERAIALGVPESCILIENQSTNTGENVTLTKKLLEGKNISVSSVIAIQKPYMERRSYATILAQWPQLDELTVQVTSPQLSWQDYPTEEISRDDVIHIMVGDLQRIIAYPKRGFMSYQEVPTEAMDAMHTLIAAGYTKHQLG
ncbi:MAG: YdcF family protein [Akkermansiaceae bacterium]